MYLPRHFEESRPQALEALVDAHPLATLVTLGPNGLEADHVPMLLETGPGDGPHGTLRGHIARPNALWRETNTAVEALAIFRAADAYVSPGWYPSKRAHGRVVPTWNYAVVHARGPLRVIHDAAWLRAFLERLTARHEAHRTPAWTIDDAPADYIARLLRGIVGIEIPITRIEGKWKLSQNHAAADRDGVVRGLQEEGSAQAAATAERMAQARAE